MGGIGSGSWYRHGTKHTVEGYNHLDVNNLNRKGLLEPGTRGSVSWSRGDKTLGSVGFEVEDDCFVLDYRHRRNRSKEWEEVRYRIPLVRTPCNFGGERPWFLCPGVVNGHYCGRRVAKLYDAGKYFLCRHCYDLSYQSQRDNRRYRALHRAQNIRRRLGGSVNMLEPFPDKPKGMHWRTYERLWWEHHEAEMEQLLGMREWLDKLQKKVG